MAIFTFSTKGSKPEDTTEIEKIKQHCYDKGINFSAVVIRELRVWHEKELANGK